MENIDVRSWEDFEERLRGLREEQLRRKNATVLSVSPFLFRGQGNHTWPLTTTLERNGRDKLSFKKYYRLISVVRPQIETFTEITWDVLDYPEYEKWLQQNDTLMPGNFPGYNYMIYLRHHGFPSPLLDWTRSPYIAAYFAFSHAIEVVERVSIYVLWEYTGSAKIWSSKKPHIHSLGPYVKSHRRHFLQQSEYTICMVHDDEWRFVPHKEAFAHVDADQEQDILWKFNIPWTERLKVLKLLDGYNVNALSLFDSEESLMETMAFRELHFRENDL
jgi:hypothetical protein